MWEPNPEKLNEIITFLKVSQSSNNDIQKELYKVTIVLNLNYKLEIGSLHERYKLSKKFNIYPQLTFTTK